MAVDDRCKRFILHTSFLSRFRDCIFLPLNFNGTEKKYTSYIPTLKKETRKALEDQNLTYVKNFTTYLIKQCC